PPPLPPHTRLPYTTISRSDRLSARDRPDDGRRRPDAAARGVLYRSTLRTTSIWGTCTSIGARSRRYDAEDPRYHAGDTGCDHRSDRKSTRLNSSHEWISYD